MTETLIDVTWPCILEAQRRPTANPVALAAADAFPGATHIVAGAAVLYLTLGDTRYERDLPDDVQYFIADYYDGMQVAPFSFTVGAPVFSYSWRPVQRPAWRAA